MALGLARSMVPVLLAIAASGVALEGFIGWTQGKARDQRLVYQRRGVHHPRYGWSWEPSRTDVETISGRNIRWAFNREGIRVLNQDDQPDPARPTILFTGESIADGWGLDYPETDAALIAARRGVQCVNLAVNSYASDQAYLRLIDAMPRYQRLLATVTIFIPVQLGRNLHDDRPRLVLGPMGELDFKPAAADFLSQLRTQPSCIRGPEPRAASSES